MSECKPNFSATLEQLAGIEAIDKFVAAEFTPLSGLNEEQNSVWLHVLVTLSFMQRNGHSCLPVNVVAGKTFFEEPTSGDEANKGEQETGTVISDESTARNVVVKKGYTFPSLTVVIGTIKKALEITTISSLFVYHNGRFYSRRYFEFEQEVAQQIHKRTRFTPLSDTASESVKALWPAMFPTAASPHQDWQQVAVAKSLVQHFSVINGGPGTGKTYTVLRLLLALLASDDSLNIVLAAPTGKAQQRMTESIVASIEGLKGAVNDTLLQRVPTQAVTLHRLLGLREHTIATRYHALNPLALDVLIVDEASMVDLALMTRIMRALPEHAALYFIGDADQLPAVELGNVLEQLVEEAHSTACASEEMLGAIPTLLRQHIATLCPHLPLLKVDEQAKTWVHTLQASQRFKGQIAEVAAAIQQGLAQQALAAIHSCSPDAQSNTQYANALKDGVYLWDELSVSTARLQRLAIESFLPIFEARDARQALTRLNQVRWLTPVRRGSMGVEALNALVFDAIKHKILRREGSFYQGQPIMIVKNNHPQRLSNGEVGIIWPDDSGKLYAWFETQDGQLRHISLSRVPQFETVYAMTIHKSQGSEFNHVILLLPKPESERAAGLFHRGLVYTGLTRAKEGCLLIANATTFCAMIEQNDKRYSGLSEAINALSVD